MGQAERMLWACRAGALLLAGAACAADPTARRWTAAEGFVNAAASWEGGVMPAQGTAAAAGEMALFTGAGDKTVRFPSGGWTDRGVYHLARGLADGATLVFDATGTSWTFAPGAYFSNWQIFTLCGDSAGGANYPHLLQVTATGGTVEEPIFTLTDGVVRFEKNSMDGNVLTLARGTWDFMRTGKTGTADLLFFAAERGATDRVVLCAGSSLRAPAVSLQPNGTLDAARFCIAGGAHAVSNLSFKAGGATAGRTCMTMQLTGGALDVGGELVVGDRADRAATNWLEAAGDARLTTMGALRLGADVGARDRTGANVLAVAGRAVVETRGGTTIGHGSPAENLLDVAGDGVYADASTLGIVLGRASGARGRLVVRENGTLRLTGNGTGSLTLSGNLEWGDNLGGETRVDVLGGTVYGERALIVGGTNAWVRLAGGETSFRTWEVKGEPRYRIDDPDWTLPTNTVEITGGVHEVRGVNGSNTSIAIGATNGNACVRLAGGELRAVALLAVGVPNMTGAPALLSVSGGTLALAPKGGDAKVMVGQASGAKGRLELRGGEIVANSVRGGSGQSTLVADGGMFTVRGAVAGDVALSRLTEARLGAKGLTVNVPQGVRAVCRQEFADLDGAEGRFVKDGVGALVVSNASAHARTVVQRGRLVVGAGVARFGRTLEIGPEAGVFVAVPGDAGTHDVLTLDAPLSDAELARLAPEIWAEGRSYAMKQTTAEGRTVVQCVVTEGVPEGRTFAEDATFETAQTLATRLAVASGASVTFKAPVACIGGKLVLDVPAGATVTFEQPVSSVATEVEKIGAGRVVFKAANPSFLGRWTQGGGVFDVRHAAFAPGADALALCADTLAYAGESPGVLAAPVVVGAASPQARVVLRADADVTAAGGWTSTGGGLVKTGAGALTLLQPAGEFRLNAGDAAAGDTALTVVPADGAAPPDASAEFFGNIAEAGLQILSGRVRVAGAGRAATTVANRQSIFVGTGWSGQEAEAGLEIADCTYRADGTARGTHIGAGVASAAFPSPSLAVTNAQFETFRVYLGDAAAKADVRPAARFADAVVKMESGFEVGAASDRVHPSLTLDNAQVTQRRDGYAEGHRFHRDFAVVLTNQSLLSATYTEKAGKDWHGLRFEAGAWGVLRVTAGSTIQTSRLEMLNDGATAARHVDLIFDGGALELTADASGEEARTAFAAPDVQGFTATGAGMEVRLGAGVAHAFATSFRGDGDLVKTGAGTFRCAAVADGKPVFRGEGDVVVQEGALDLGGLAETNVCFVGAGGVVSNGTCAVKAAPDAAALLRVGAGTTLARLVVAGDAAALADGQKVPVAQVEPGADVALAPGCAVQTPDPNLRGVAAVEGDRVVVTLQTRRRLFILVR